MGPDLRAVRVAADVRGELSGSAGGDFR
jgi:hypothetical protein